MTLKLKNLVIVLFLILSSCANIDSFRSPESSWIIGATYNIKTQTLIIETETKDYTFIDVPLDVWEGFKNADSKGSYYHEKIRSKFKF